MWLLLYLTEIVFENCTRVCIQRVFVFFCPLLRPVLWRGLNIARLCAHDAAQQSPKSPIRVKRYCDGGYQLNLSSPVLCFVLCARSHKRGRLTSYYSTSVRKWIDPGPHILLKMSRLLLCRTMKNSKKPSRQKVTLSPPTERGRAAGRKLLTV